MSKGAILGPDSANCLCLYPTLGISVIPGECVHLIDLSFGTWVHPLLNDSQKLDPSYVVIPSFYTVSAADVLWFGLEFNCAALHNSQEVKTPSSRIFPSANQQSSILGALRASLDLLLLLVQKLLRAALAGQLPPGTAAHLNTRQEKVVMDSAAASPDPHTPELPRKTHQQL